MATKKDRVLQPILNDLLRRVDGNPALEAMAQRVVNEFNKIVDVDSTVKDPRRRRINKLLHAMRGLETGLETFLAIYGIAPNLPKDKNMGSFMKKLQNPPRQPNTFTRIPSQVFAYGSTNSDSIRCKRNKYLHQADLYPTEQEIKRIIEEVYKFYQQVLNLS